MQTIWQINTVLDFFLAQSPLFAGNCFMTCVNPESELPWSMEGYGRLENQRQAFTFIVKTDVMSEEVQ